MIHTRKEERNTRFFFFFFFERVPGRRLSQTPALLSHPRLIVVVNRRRLPSHVFSFVLQSRWKVHHQRIGESVHLHVEDASRLRKVLIRPEGSQRLLGGHQGAQCRRDVCRFRSGFSFAHRADGAASAGSRRRRQDRLADDRRGSRFWVRPPVATHA